MRKKKDQFVLAVLIPLIIMLGLLGVVITIKTTSLTTEVRSQASSNERILKEWTFDKNTLEGWTAKGFAMKPVVNHRTIELGMPTTINTVSYPYIQKNGAINIPPKGETSVILTMMFGPQPEPAVAQEATIQADPQTSGGSEVTNINAVKLENAIQLEYKLKNKSTFEAPVIIPVSSRSSNRDFTFTLPPRLTGSRIGSAGYNIDALRIRMIFPKSPGIPIAIDRVRIVNIEQSPAPTSIIPVADKPTCEMANNGRYGWKYKGSFVSQNGMLLACTKGEIPFCKNTGTRSEGWYTKAGTKIVLATCGSTLSSTPPPPEQLIY